VPSHPRQNFHLTLGGLPDRLMSKNADVPKWPLCGYSLPLAIQDVTNWIKSLTAFLRQTRFCAMNAAMAAAGRLQRLESM
jgi:hypothetical protein